MPSPSLAQSFPYVAERFADIQLLRYELKGFSSLSLRQKKLIYFLSEATLVGRDITFDQHGAFNLKVRRVLEAVYIYYKGERTSNDLEFQALEEYLKQVWFASGIHHHYNNTKFVPRFSEQFIRAAIDSLAEDQFPLDEGEDKAALCDWIVPILFCPTLYPKRVCLDEGVDKLLASSCNFYQGLSQAEAEEYYEVLRAQDDTDEPPSYGLNTTLIKEDGRIREEVWKLSGRYTEQLERVVYWLTKALDCCESKAQEEVIRLLIEYYSTGSLSLFDRYSIAWVSADSTVDFINGFIEVYGDPLGIKGTWEGLVHYKDVDATRRTQTLCAHAQWFEDNSPIDARFRKKEVKGVSANVVNAAMLGGEEYPSSAIGINLPNADWLRSRYGSKSITIGNLTRAYAHTARSSGMREEFIADERIRALIEEYDEKVDDLHTDLHECLGHGSGQLLAGVSSGALRSYGSVIEEARADLFALYYIADEKLIDLGLLPNSEAYKAEYYSYMLNGLLTQLVRIPLGGQLEEAHMRNRALIARWVMEKSGGAVRLVKGSKTFLEITDYSLLRRLFAALLWEVQRIKSEGDYEAARLLVENYGVTIDYELHKEVLERYATLSLAPYKGFLNPVLRPIVNAQKEIIDVEVDYSEGYVEQMLRYSREY